MDYIKELEAHLAKVRAAKLLNVKEGKWARAAACRDVELAIEKQLKEVKERAKEMKYKGLDL